MFKGNLVMLRNMHGFSQEELAEQFVARMKAVLECAAVINDER